MDALTYEKASLCLAFALTWLFFGICPKKDLLKAAKNQPSRGTLGYRYYGHQ